MLTDDNNLDNLGAVGGAMGGAMSLPAVFSSPLTSSLKNKSSSRGGSSSKSSSVSDSVFDEVDDTHSNTYVNSRHGNPIIDSNRLVIPQKAYKPHGSKHSHGKHSTFLSVPDSKSLNTQNHSSDKTTSSAVSDFIKNSSANHNGTRPKTNQRNTFGGFTQLSNPPSTSREGNEGSMSIPPIPKQRTVSWIPPAPNQEDSNMEVLSDQAGNVNINL